MTVRYRDLDYRDVAILEHAGRVAQRLLDHGVRQEHGIGPASPVLPEPARQLARIIAAVDVLLDRPVAVDSRFCRSCGEQLPIGARSDVRYCSPRCRQRAHRAAARAGIPVAELKHRAART